MEHWTRPSSNTFTTRVESRTVICHGVTVSVVDAAEIQPLCPFGRPGNRTSSQHAPAPA
jgi:hypothetical protein